MLQITAKGYVSDNAIVFQRLTVIVSDFVYFYAVLQWCQIINKLKTRFTKQSLSDLWFHPKIILAMLFLWNPGLLIVDHIHFQYNGILSGILLLSMARIVEKREVEASFWFSVLLNMKHIYAYISPAFFVYLLRNYCFDRHMNFKLKNFIKLSLTVALVFVVSFGPFIALGQLSQVISRLFPFKRGLSHAYWAPNCWAVYNSLDKVLSVALKVSVKSNASMTGGLVQQYDHLVLPNITPLITLILVVVSMLVSLFCHYKCQVILIVDYLLHLRVKPTLNLLWKRSHQNYSPVLFIRCLVLCAYSSYLFGWHVHEKAILLITIPLTPLALISKSDAKYFNLVSIVGNFSLFPLLYKEAETLTKILLLVIYSVYSLKSLETHHKTTASRYEQKSQFDFPLMNGLETIYLLGLVFVQTLYSSCPSIGLCQRYPFVPLMLTSLYCSLGLIYCYINLFKNLRLIKS